MSTEHEGRVLGLEYGEILLLSVFWLFSAGIFVRSYSYPGFTGRFPRLFAAAALVGATLLLLRNKFPEPVQKLATSSGSMEQMTDAPDELEMSDVDEPAADEEIQQDAVGRPISDTWFLSLAVAGFFVLSYLTGMLWASPVFALAYGLWYRKSWQYTVLMVALTFGIPFAFYDILNLPIADGYLHELLGIT